MSLAQIGEFSFIIAGLGLSLKATSSFLYPVAVAISAITTLLTPWLIRASTPVAKWVDRKLPRPLQTFGALYGSWLERLRASGTVPGTLAPLRRLVLKLIIDGVALTAIIIAGSLGSSTARTYLVERRLLSPDAANVIALGLVALLAAPFCIGIVRVGRKLGKGISDLVFAPIIGTQLDLAAAPRRALVVTLDLVILLFVGLPIVAVTQPFLPGFQGAKMLFAILVLLGIASWRTARNLQGHVRAGAQMIVEMLARQSHVKEEGAEEADAPAPLAGLLQGLGEPVAIAVAEDSVAAEKTLSDLDLRGITGATVLVITRGESSYVIPTATERLHAGDTVALAGTREAIASARVLLSGSAAPNEPPSRR
jgi:CPA2 family monovalent cation:H+ antiporter-2